MSDSTTQPSHGPKQLDPSDWRREWLGRWPALAFVLPLGVFLAVTSLEPTPQRPGGETIGLAIPYEWYPWLYGGKLILTAAAVWFVWPAYRGFSFRLSRRGFTALGWGLLGAAVWVGLAEWDLEARYLQPWLAKVGLDWIIASGQRTAFDPFAQISGPAVWAWAFLVVRFAGLVLLVPLVEEFFLRAFAMRFVIQSDWWQVPFGTLTPLAALVGTLIPVLMHPAELLAAAVWFSLITVLMARTRNIWDCILAHAATNLAMGVYAVAWGRWGLL